eukprot:6179148-Pleurochrysis_carterae.AAC.1
MARRLACRVASSYQHAQTYGLHSHDLRRRRWRARPSRAFVARRARAAHAAIETDACAAPPPNSPPVVMAEPAPKLPAEIVSEAPIARVSGPCTIPWGLP